MELTYKDIYPGRGRAYNADCFDVMKEMPDGCVDMILCDLPYGTTACKWDNVIPFAPMWAEFHRVVKPNAAIVLFGAEPFSSHLRLSNLTWFKYDWIWAKSKALGFANSKYSPLRKHEIISVFSEGTVTNNSRKRMPYFPQGLVPYGKQVSGIKTCKADSAEGGHRLARPGNKETYIREFTNFPTSVLEIASEGKGFHPTQKPVALFEYLIKTYTKPGDLVFDPTAGSLTTGVAAQNLGRRWVCVEQDATYFQKGCERFS